MNTSFGDFIRDQDLTFYSLFIKGYETLEYYIFAHGPMAILYVIGVIYFILMAFPPTRPLATLMLNTIFRQPFDIARDIMKGTITAIKELGVFISSSIRDSRDKD